MKAKANEDRMNTETECRDPHFENFEFDRESALLAGHSCDTLLVSDTLCLSA